MIYYKTNDNWFGDLRHLATSWTMVRIVRSVLLIGAYSAAVCITIEYLELGSYLNLNTSVFSLLGVELLGEEIEDPFGLDCNDLPTGDMAHTIKGNVFEILEDRHPVEQHKKELYEKVF
jgi:predicted membrane chloride channel (bestrophin family)